MAFDDRTGGPAFPPANSPYLGMTLRDWFAGQALIGLHSNSNYHANAEGMSRHAYEFADAMIKARRS